VAEPFLSEIKIVSFGFAPKGWALCNGQLLPINQNQALFSLLLTTYGGDGRVNFALPNLQGRVPIHIGNGFAQGQAGGEQAHTLTIGELPQHIHSAFGSSTLADQPTPGGNLLGTVDVTAFTTNVYAGPGNLVAMTPATIANAGGSQAHLNMQPFLTLNFCIALQGAFPSRN
jgi:microcystin-dependent protein